LISSKEARNVLRESPTTVHYAKKKRQRNLSEPSKPSKNLGPRPIQGIEEKGFMNPKDTTLGQKRPLIYCLFS